MSWKRSSRSAGPTTVILIVRRRRSYYLEFEGRPTRSRKDGRRRNWIVILSCRRIRSTRLGSGTYRLYRDRGSTSSG